MADAQKSAAFNQSELLDAVSRLDRDSNGVTLEELRIASRYHSGKLMENLRSAAAELRSEANPNPEKVEALRGTLERLASLNALKSSQEKEITALYNGEMKDFYALFTELRARIDSLKTDVAANSGKNVVTDAVVDSPAPAPAVKKSTEKNVESSFAAKRDYLLGDASLFQNSEGERTTAFGREQLRKLISDKRVVGNEEALDLLVMRLTGLSLNVENEEEAKSVRARFIEALSIRLTTLSSLYEKTVGEKLGNKSSGGLIHILKGQEHVLVSKIFAATEYLEAKGVDNGSGITFEKVAETLKAIGLGLLLGPVYLDMRSRKGLAHSEIKTGKKSDPLSWKSSDSKTNAEFRISPALKIFGIALGITAEVNANLNDREAEIVGKVKEAAAAYDSAIDPETGTVDETKVPNIEDARAYNRTLEQMKTGDAARDKVLIRSLRDANLLEFADRLVRMDSGVEFKGIGAGVALLFGILPIKAFAKVNIQNLSAKIVPGKVDALSAYDSVRLGKGKLDQFGISMKEIQNEGFEYSIDSSKGYAIDNRTSEKLVNGVIKSEKPLYFRHLEVVSDSMKEGEVSVQTLVISNEPFAMEAEKSPKPSVYESFSNDALRNEVIGAMRGITSRHIRYRATGIPALQEAIAKASASGNPEEAYKLLALVRVEGKNPLAALSNAHSKDSPTNKRELLNMILQETAGDWRVRNFDAIKNDPAAFKDFAERTGYRGTQKALRLSHVSSAWNLGKTFDKNLLVKTGLKNATKEEQKEALAALGSARTEYSKELGKLDSIEKNSREIQNAIGFVNFHQVAIDSTGKAHKRFQEIVPVTGTVKAVDVEPTKFESAAMRKQLVSEIPTFVLESLRDTVNAQAKKVGAEEIATVEDVRKLLMNNGSKSEGSFRPDIQLTSNLAYTRFAKCLNDTYLIQNINLCVTGPDGKTYCNPTIPEVTSDLIAPVGASETSVDDYGIGVAFNTGIGGGGKDGGGNNGGPGGTTTPGVGGGPGTVTTPGGAAWF